MRINKLSFPITISALLMLITLFSCEKKVTETYQVANNSIQDSIFVVYWDIDEGHDSLWIGPSSTTIIYYNNDLGRKGTATDAADNKGGKITDLVIFSIRQNTIESKINYSLQSSWSFRIEDYKSKNGTYTLNISDFDF